uniref:Putative ovule protein n=1 Tax=Solanum chacoense TaxID=4108 RepID=A0A0V0HR39_SOLCH
MQPICLAALLPYLYYHFPGLHGLSNFLLTHLMDVLYHYYLHPPVPLLWSIAIQVQSYAGRDNLSSCLLVLHNYNNCGQEKACCLAQKEAP